jgi:hypothetical protein
MVQYGLSRFIITGTIAEQSLFDLVTDRNHVRHLSGTLSTVGRSWNQVHTRLNLLSVKRWALEVQYYKDLQRNRTTAVGLIPTGISPLISQLPRIQEAKRLERAVRSSIYFSHWLTVSPKKFFLDGLKISVATDSSGQWTLH